MSYPSADKLAEMVGSRYTLVVLAAKRAKQLKDGAPKLIDTNSTNPLTVALEEIAAGKVKCYVPDTDARPLPRETEPELLTPSEMLLAEPESESPAPAESEEVLAIEGEQGTTSETREADSIAKEPQADIGTMGLEAISAQLDAAEAEAQAEASEEPEAEAASVELEPELPSEEETRLETVAEAAVLGTDESDLDPAAESTTRKRRRKKAESVSEVEAAPAADEPPAAAESSPEEAKPKRKRKAGAS